MRGDTRPVISMITPVIYLANAEAARSQNIISEFRIKRIISVTNDPDYRPSAEFLKKYGVEQRIFPIEDMEFHGRDSLLTEELFPWAREAEQKSIPTIIHCRASVSRSPAFTIAYLMWRGATDNEAILHVLASHHIAAPRQDVMESFFSCLKKEFKSSYAFTFRWRRAQGWFKRLI